MHDHGGELGVVVPVVKGKELDRQPRPLPRRVVANAEQQPHQEVRGQESNGDERDGSREIDGRHDTILRRAA